MYSVRNPQPEANPTAAAALNSSATAGSQTQRQMQVGAAGAQKNVSFTLNTLRGLETNRSLKMFEPIKSIQTPRVEGADQEDKVNIDSQKKSSSSDELKDQLKVEELKEEKPQPS